MDLQAGARVCLSNPPVPQLICHGDFENANQYQKPAEFNMVMCPSVPLICIYDLI